MAKETPKKKPSRAKSLSTSELTAKIKAAKEELKGADSKSVAVLEVFKKAKIALPLLVAGDDQLRTRRLVNWIREQFFSAEAGTKCNSSYFASDVNSPAALSQITNSFKTPSLFAPVELVTIYEVDKIKAPLVKQLTEELSGGTGTVLLILAASEFPTKEPFSDLTSHGTIITVTELKGADLQSWIQREAKFCGVSEGITPDAVRILTATYGSDVTSLSQEISKLALLTPQGQKINGALVQKLLHASPEQTTFGLIETMAKKEKVRTAKLVTDLLDQGFHPLQLTSLLSRSFRTMLAAKSKTNSEQLETVSSELNNPWFLRNLRTAIALFSEQELLGSVEVLKKLDLKLKGSGLPENLTMALAMHQISQRSF